jgi:hypothetical protein
MDYHNREVRKEAQRFLSKSYLSAKLGGPSAVICENPKAVFRGVALIYMEIVELLQGTLCPPWLMITAKFAKMRKDF